jgi:NAD(P)-dependent dehydrogenase (short-subunit alcohol dehydrogenase family)
MNLEGRVAMVTGGGAGIGRGIVMQLARAGADVAIVDISANTAKDTAKQVQALGRKSLVIIADASESEQAEQALKKTLDTFGKLDILVNNVGGESKYYHVKEGQPYSEEQEWDDTVRLNLKTTMIMCHTVAPYFVERRSGKIVNISSVGGRPPSGMRAPGMSVEGQGASFGPMMSYAVAKAGVIQFSRALALQLAGYNVNVNCVCPGVVYTPLYERSFPRRQEATPGAKGMDAREYFDKFVVSRVPLGREQTVEDIGNAAVFFVSEEARNITGQALNVDGGMFPG